MRGRILQIRSTTEYDEGAIFLWHMIEWQLMRHRTAPDQLSPQVPVFLAGTCSSRSSMSIPIPPKSDLAARPAGYKCLPADAYIVFTCFVSCLKGRTLASRPEACVSDFSQDLWHVLSNRRSNLGLRKRLVHRSSYPECTLQILELSLASDKDD